MYADSSRILNVLYLHGGPGFNCEMERIEYGSLLPVDWWDQPLVAGTASPFETLVNAAVLRLRNLAQLRGAPVHLLANSFGTHLAFELLQRVPESIASATLAGPVQDLYGAYLRFAERLAAWRSDDALMALCRSADNARDERSFWSLVGHVATLDGFTDCYWGPAAQKQRQITRELLQAGRLIDMPTFESVVRDFMASPRPAPSLNQGKPIRVLLGKHDPFFADEAIQTWQRLCPQASVEVVDAGHFPHLELPPDVWLPV